MLGTELINDDFYKQLNRHNLDLLQRPKFQILQAICALLFADTSMLRKHIANYNRCNEKLISELNQKEQLFCSAYCDFLSNLIEASSIIDPNSADYGTLFHLGESHCLSYAHQKIKIQGIDYKIKPKITFAGKTFHFARRKEDAFKAITKANFDSVPDCSKVFVSFGEIDCRADEGFIEAAQKLDIHIDELITDVVKGYFTWFVKQKEVKKHHLYFFNIPAPIYAKDISP